MGKNARLLASLVLYCNEHPEERFWQALRNWSGENFILISNFAPHDFGKEGGWLEDTFYLEGMPNESPKRKARG